MTKDLAHGDAGVGGQAGFLPAAGLDGGTFMDAALCGVRYKFSRADATVLQL